MSSALTRILNERTAFILGGVVPQTVKAQAVIDAEKLHVETSGEGVVDSRRAQEMPSSEQDGGGLAVAPLSLNDPRASLCLENQADSQRRQPAIGPAFAVLAFGSGVFLLRASRTESPRDEPGRKNHQAGPGQPPLEHHHLAQVEPRPVAGSSYVCTREEIKAMLRVPWAVETADSRRLGRQTPHDTSDVSRGSSNGEMDAKIDEEPAVADADKAELAGVCMTRLCVCTAK